MNITVQTGSLRLEMSQDEMQRHGVSYAELDRDSDKSKSFLSRIYSLGRCAAGFSAVGDRLMIEVFPAPDGGCIIYFTPEGAIRQEETSKLRLRKSKKPRKIYLFDRLSPLLDAIKTLGTQGGTDRQPPALFEKDGRYYLAAEPAQDTERILSEYGGMRLKTREETLTEHARLISEDVFRDIYSFLS